MYPQLRWVYYLFQINESKHLDTKIAKEELGGPIAKLYFKQLRRNASTADDSACFTADAYCDRDLTLLPSCGHSQLLFLEAELIPLDKGTTKTRQVGILISVFVLAIA